MNSRWIIDVDVEDRTIKILEGNKKKFIHDLQVAKNFLNKTPNIPQLQMEINVFWK